jgi:hypothetical protein
MSVPAFNAYPDTLVLTRPSGAGTQNADIGTFTPAAATTVYSGVCDAQDRPRVLKRDETGQPTLSSDIDVFLPWPAWPISGVKEEDLAALTYADGATALGRVVKVQHLDRTLMVMRA